MDLKIESSPIVGNIISMMVMITVIVSPVVMLKIAFEFLYCFYGFWNGMLRYVIQLMRGGHEPVQDYPKFQTERKENGTYHSSGFLCHQSHKIRSQSDHITNLNGCNIVGLINGSSLLPSLRRMLQQTRSNHNIPYKDLHAYSDMENLLKTKVMKEKEICGEEPLQKMYSSRIVIGNANCKVMSAKAGIYHVSCKISRSSNTEQQCCSVNSQANSTPVGLLKNGFHQTLNSTTSHVYLKPVKTSADTSVRNMANSVTKVGPANTSGSNSLSVQLKLKPKLDFKSTSSSMSITLIGGMTYEILSAKLLKVGESFTPEDKPLIVPSNTHCLTDAPKCPLNGATEHKSRTFVERRDSEGDDFIVFCDVTVEGAVESCHAQEHFGETCWSDSGEESDDEEYSGSSEDESSDDEYESGSDCDEVDSAKEGQQPRYGCQLMRNVFENLCWTGDALPKDENSFDSSEASDSSADESATESEDSEGDLEEDDDAAEVSGEPSDGSDIDCESFGQITTNTIPADEVDHLNEENMNRSKQDGYTHMITMDSCHTTTTYDLSMQNSRILHTDLGFTTFRSCTGTLISFRNPLLTEECLKTSFPSSEHDHPAKQRNSTKKKTVTFAPADELATVHHMVAWNYAYREARKGHWEQYARDRSHFRRRIDNLSSIIEPILRKKLDNMM